MANIRIKGLGGFSEVSASSAQAEFLGKINRNALVDSGIRMINKRGRHGEFIRRSEGHVLPDIRIDAAVITHGHSDHNSNLPRLWPGIVEANPDAKAYMTKPTFYIASNLWLNYSHLMKRKEVNVDSRYESNFNKGMKMLVQQVQNTWIEKPGWVEIFPGVDAYFGPNGHIRGSAFVVFRVDVGNGKYIYIMFSGDLSVYDSPTVKGLKFPGSKELKGDEKSPLEEFVGKIDIMFVESTYGDRVLIPRAEEEDRMAYLAKETINRSGICLAPAFGVGRSPDAALAQEIRSVTPLYMDGMGKQFMDICASLNGHWCELDHMSGVDLASSGIKYVESRGEREELIYESGGFSVVTTAGMMIKGSCAWQYATENHFLENSRNSVLQTGYQAEGTEGRDLQEAVRHGEPFSDGNGRGVIVRAEVPPQLQLSSHADGGQIAEIVNALRPKKVFINHGDDNGREGLKNNLLNLGFRDKVHLPKNGDVIEI